MSTGDRTDERPSGSLVGIVRERFGLWLDDVVEGWAGEESVGWRISSSDGERFVQRFPAWRQVGGLTWCDDVAAAAATVSHACVHAVAADDGQRVIATPEGPVMVFPFIEGTQPDDATIADEAAAQLAIIHRGIVASWVDRDVGAPRPFRRSVPLTRTRACATKSSTRGNAASRRARARSSRYMGTTTAAT